LPPTFATPEIKVPVADAVKFAVMEKIIAACEAKFDCDLLDGVRMNFDRQAWGLIRASNTSPYLTLRFEAASAERLLECKRLIRGMLGQYPELDVSRV
jgi:phosphomannomutase/phosphoglucomutase